MPFRARGKWVQKRSENGKWSNWREEKNNTVAKKVATKLNIKYHRKGMK